MRTLKLLVPVLLAAAAAPSAVRAQACLGLPSFANGSVHLNVAGEFPDSATAYAVGIGAGKQDALFANLGGGLVEFEGYDQTSKFGFLEFGYQFPLGSAQLCPIGGGTYATGPDDETYGLKVTSRSATGGLALGLPIGMGAFRLIPNAAVKYDHTSVKFDEEGIGSSRETYKTGIVDVGLGFVFFDRISIQPLAHIPIYSNIDDDKVSYGVFGSFSFGWRAR